ncbi:MAG TPA: hypothetical protein VLL05_17815 [Terriglobales bacterium]|nr:hypothetical protein [Terriglobales bacterium]
MRIKPNSLSVIGSCAWRTVMWLATLSFFTVVAKAQQLIDFEDLPPGQATVLNQYNGKGVSLNGPLGRDYSQMPGFAHSGTRAIELCFAAEFCTIPLNVSFTTAQKHVKLWVGSSGALSQSTTVVMQALDQNGVMISQTSAVLNASNLPIPVQTPLQIDTPAPAMRQVTVSFSSGSNGLVFNNGLVIDDVEFDSAGSSPACGTTVRPSVAMSQPMSGETVEVNEFTLQGSVVTPVPLDAARLTVTNGPWNVSGDLLFELLPRTGGNLGPISVFEMLSPGTNQLSVSAADCAGTAQNTRTVIYNPIASGTRFKVLGFEVTQATQDIRDSVPVIADKPTIVRVYLSLEGPTTVIHGVTGEISATRPGGGILGILQSGNSVIVDATQTLQTQRLDLTKSVNFTLPPDWYAQGTLHFEIVRLSVGGYSSSLPCDGCDLNLPNATYYFNFEPTRSLNLVLAPYVYGKNGFEPDFFLTPMGALQWLNNVYPLKGNFPQSGSGINLVRILPTQTMNHDLHTENGINDFMDDLHGVLDNLRSQQNLPPDTHLFGMTPCGCGGIADLPGNVAYGDTWATQNGVVPQTNFEGYGQIWAQEIAHNYNRMHAGNSHNEQPPTDSNFPYLHGSIGEPGVAITTEWWNGSPFLIQPGVPIPNAPYNHAHDFMSYGAVNDPSEHTFSWVSPYTYEALYQQLLNTARVERPTTGEATEKLVVAGHLEKSGAKLRPFYVTKTAFRSGSGDTGEYTIELLDAEGKTLLNYKFDVRQTGDGTSPSFSEFVPWTTGTRKIVIRDKKSVLATREVSAHKPWVKVTSPKGGELWGAKATITWEAGDEDKSPLTFAVFYNDGRSPIWLQLSDGLTKKSLTIDTALIPGSAKGRIRVRVTDGVNTAEAETEKPFRVEEKKPLVTILFPRPGQVVAPESETEFIGAAYDVQDGMLPSSSLMWSSNRNGLLGEGQKVRTKKLSRGTHVVTLTATDGNGNSTSTDVRIVVGRDRFVFGGTATTAKP